MFAKLRVVVLLFLCVLALPVSSEVRFWEMPRGCQWTVEYSNGNIWEERFVGKRSGQYVVKTRKKFGDRAHVSTTFFNARGLMTRRVWAGNKWEAFEPFSCFGVEGTCTNTYRNADGERFEITSTTKRIGENRFRVQARSSKTGAFDVDTVSTTHYGLTLLSKNKNFWAKTTEMRNCGVPVS